MKKDLVKRATIGDPATPWETLLALGAEALRGIGEKCPKPTIDPNSVLFCEPDEGDALTEEQADRLLGPFKEEFHTIGYTVGKRFPASRIPRLLNYLKCANFAEETFRQILGKGGMFLALVSREISLTPRRFLYEALAPELLEREASRVAMGDGNPWDRTVAVRALWERDPEKGRALFRQVWNSAEKSRKDGEKLRFNLIESLVDLFGDEDVSFLEDALENEKPKVVRIIVRALAQIPNSRVAQTLRSIGDSILAPDGRFVPPRYSDELKKLGFPKVSSSVLGALVLSLIPLARWEERFALSPEEIALRVPLSLETVAIYAGWTTAFANFGGQAVWVRALKPFELAIHGVCARDKELTAFVRSFYDDYRSNEKTKSYFDGNYRYWSLMEDVDSQTALEIELEIECGSIKDERKREIKGMPRRMWREPRPWSEAFCEEVFRVSFENGPISNELESELVLHIRNFPIPMRKKIIDELKKNPNASKRRPASIKAAERKVKLLDEMERFIEECRRS
ncbi:MAG: HEAT repeat domain-containing protein [Thermoguttaceae bacterium]|nr:HEAT repeat domain-containing protein [Thermoguttaceae bacterium]